jgi:hypothetical protein
MPQGLHLQMAISVKYRLLYSFLQDTRLHPTALFFSWNTLPLLAHIMLLIAVDALPLTAIVDECL